MGRRESRRLVEEWEREFYRAATHWLDTRLRIERDEGDRFGRELGECDWRAEMRLILKSFHGGLAEGTPRRVTPERAESESL